jgi:hypothetical protein
LIKERQWKNHQPGEDKRFRAKRVVVVVFKYSGKEKVDG